MTGRTTLTPRLHPKHRVLRATRSNKSEASSADGCFPPPPPPCQPERPCLSPRPNVIMLCFAQGDVDTFVEVRSVSNRESDTTDRKVSLIAIVTGAVS